MSGLLLPPFAPAATRRCVTSCLMRTPGLARLLDTPGLLAAVCMEAITLSGDAQVERLHAAAAAPHRKLATDVGIPSLSVLRRMTGESMSSHRFAALRQLFAEKKELRFLRHARYISSVLIDTLSNEVVRAHASNGYVSELGQLKRRDRPSARDARRLAAFLQEFVPTVSVQSMRHFDRLWNDYYEQLMQYQVVSRRGDQLREPPWPDEAGYALALRTRTELIAESLAMRNCAGVVPYMMKAVKKGMGYFFRIEANWGLPRATLYCVKDGDFWRVEDARCRFNQPVSTKFVRCMALWVAQKQGLENEQLCMPIRRIEAAIRP